MKKGGGFGLAVIVAGLSTVAVVSILLSKLSRKKQIDASLDAFDIPEEESDDAE